MDATMKLDAQGRIAIPAAIRSRLGLEAGDTLFARLDEETGSLQIAKAINPFDLLYDYAVKEYRAGRTISLRDFAASEGVDLDAANE